MEQEQFNFAAPKPEDICRVKHGGNGESEEANRKVDKAEWQNRVLKLARERGEHGITADEAAEHYGVAHNTVAPRMSELRKDGRLIPTLQRRKTRAGCSAMVLVARVD